ncbi:MAG: anthranilate synthase component I family protein [Bacteroidetes bacterium]|nr:anthranilate synthase component I family protein [Bacteroidota bacterium]
MHKKIERKTASFHLNCNGSIFKEKMLNWCSRYSIFSFLDSCNYVDRYSRYDCLAAAGEDYIFSGDLDAFSDFYEKNNDWLFGHFSYDLQNENEPTINEDGFKKLCFFRPKTVLMLQGEMLNIASTDKAPETIFKEIQQEESTTPKIVEHPGLDIQADTEKHEYISIIKKLKAHIQRGDCYEVNFCLQFFAEDCLIDPQLIFKKLKAISPNPFACLYRIDNNYLIGASPERFIQKQGMNIITQPIKGTAQRDLNDLVHDAIEKRMLRESLKECSEHVMAVDLARNDFSHFCNEGSVSVPALYSIYGFPQVYQMISTIEGKVPDQINLASIIAAAFPMASMTGAPKKKVMELIGKFEKSTRGIFSGAVGYITPQKNFDFNVVIRSMIYHASDKRLRFPVGGGITWRSDPEMEYEECLLKASAMMKILS